MSKLEMNSDQLHCPFRSVLFCFIIILFLLRFNICIPIEIEKIYKGILAKTAAQKVSVKGTKWNNLKQKGQT